MLLIFLLAVQVSRLPAYLVAEDPTSSATRVLDRAQAALQQNNWDAAAEAFAQALELSDASTRDSINQQLQWCRAQTAVDKRYSDGSLAQLIKTTDPYQAQAQLAETLALIEKEYYQSLDRNEWLPRALLQLQAALENQAVIAQFNINNDHLDQLIQKVKQTLQEVTQWPDHSTARILQLSLSLRRLSDQAGLSASWPAIALSYASADCLDKYSYLFSPDQYETLRDQLSGVYVGIGVELTMTGPYPQVFDVIPDGPADRAGIAAGDTIISVDSQSLKDKSEPQVSALLKGSRGSRLNILVTRGPMQLEFSISRDLLSSPTVRHCRLIGDKKHLGYLRVASFDYDTAMEMSRALDNLNSQGAQAYIIDLRANGGGLMTSAIDAVRLFIDSGTITTVNSNRQKTRYEAGGNTCRSYRKPMVILVDQNTASAAEIFAAALQDHRRAVIIGRKTVGKALVQTVYDLNHTNTALCITTASYTPPSDISFLNTGITPDIIVEKTSDIAANDPSIADYLSENDPVMRRGITILTRIASS